MENCAWIPENNLLQTYFLILFFYGLFEVAMYNIRDLESVLLDMSVQTLQGRFGDDIAGAGDVFY